LVGSPAIDAGDDSVCPVTDQRNIPRPIGPHCDVGAFEFVPAPALALSIITGAKVGFVSQPQKTYLLESSTNLVDWTSVAMCVSDTRGMVGFQDVTAGFLGWRFYRIQER
jgi:hypothetical protein